MLTLLIGWLTPLLLLLQPTEAKPPKFSAKLLAAESAIVPGKSVDLAIALEIEKPWHIYHPILLDTGFPTTVDFELPDGLSVGPIRFPTPDLAVAFDAEYLGLHGKPVLLTTLTAVADLPIDQPLEIRATVGALACIEACIPVETSARLKLSVQTDKPAPTNADVFKAARQALPPPLADAPFLKGSKLLASHAKIPVKGKGELLARIEIQPGHHIQDRDPGVKDLVATRLFIETVEGITFEDALWPKPKTRDVKGIGKVREHGGTLLVRVPFEVSDDKFEPRPLQLRALLQYQACNDAGQCFPPELVEGAFEFQVVAADAAAEESPEAEKLIAMAGATASSASSTAPQSTKLPDAAAANDGGSPATEDRSIVTGSAAAPASGNSGSGPPVALWQLFLFAFLGGVILNVMPCVLPVLSLKIFSFMQQAGDNPGRVAAMGLIYAVGILASFAALAVVMVTFGLAWGGWMQEPAFVIVLMALLLAFALSMMGVFELRLPGMIENVAGAVTTRDGYGGAFVNGVMATALATPCTAPLLGSAVGVLVQLPPLVAGAGIMTVGVGLAAPYVLLTAFPAWLKYLPRPGPWMVKFKEFMGFLLLATLIWLLWGLQFLVDPAALVATASLLLGVGLACWLLGQITLSSSIGTTLALWGSAAAAIALGWWIGFDFLGGAAGMTPKDAPEVAQAGVSSAARGSASTNSKAADGAESTEAAPPLNWRPWAPGLDQDLARQGYTVYVDFTAKWCLTCQANKRLVLETDAVRQRVDELNVVMLIADFTRRNPAIQQELRKYRRAGVPLNIVVPAGKPDQAIVLPEALTQSIVLGALEQAGASTARDELAQRVAPAAPTAAADASFR